MNVSRRNFILASVSLMAAGCAHTPPARELASAPRPSAEWPDHGYIPHAGGLGTAPPAPAAKPNPAPIVAREAPPAPAIPQPAPGGAWEALVVVQLASKETSRVRLRSPAGPVLEFIDLPYQVA